MPETTTRRARRPLIALALALAVAGAAALAPGSTPGAAGWVKPVRAIAPGPVLAYVSESGIVVVDTAGQELSRTPRKLGGFSLGGNLLVKVGDRADSTIGLHARTGKRRFRIVDTLLTPTVLRNGKAVAFSGQGKRDRYATSLWMRDQAGRERQLIQFSFSSGSPGVPTGTTEGTVLDYSFSDDASVAAVVGGDEIVNFEYDIWTVDVDSGKKRRLTKGLSSRYPAVSPDGGRVAYFREESNCGGPMPGYRAGDLVTVSPDGTRRRVVHDGDCKQYLTRPRWLDSNLLVGVLHTRRDGKKPDPLYASQVVILDTARGVMSQPISETDRVGEISVSPSAQRVVYNDWTAPDGFWVYQWSPGSGAPAGQESWAQGTSTHVDQGWAPHLRGDYTLNPSY